MAASHKVNWSNQSSGAAEFAISVKSCHHLVMMMTVLLWGVLEKTATSNKQSMATARAHHAPWLSMSEFVKIG